MFEIHQTPEFTKWLRRLRDDEARDRIIARLVVMLGGGDKSSQDRDIKRAKLVAEGWR